MIFLCPPSLLPLILSSASSPPPCGSAAATFSRASLLYRQLTVPIGDDGRLMYDGPCAPARHMA